MDHERRVDGQGQAQRREEPEPAVGRRAAADAEVDPPDAGVEHRPEHLARADRSRRQPGPVRPVRAARAPTPRPARRQPARRRRSRASGPRSRGQAGRGRPRFATPSRRPPRSPRPSPRRRRPAGPGAPRRPGRARSHPAASARATSTDVREPLNESGATRTARGRSGRSGRRASVPAPGRPRRSRRSAERRASARYRGGRVAHVDPPKRRPVAATRAAASLTSIRRPRGARGTPGSGSSAAARGRPAR